MAGYEASNIPSLVLRVELQKSAVFFIRQVGGLATGEFTDEFFGFCSNSRMTPQINERLGAGEKGRWRVNRYCANQCDIDVMGSELAPG